MDDQREDIIETIILFLSQCVVNKQQLHLSNGFTMDAMSIIANLTIMRSCPDLPTDTPEVTEPSHAPSA